LHHHQQLDTLGTLGPLPHPAGVGSAGFVPHGGDGSGNWINPEQTGWSSGSTGYGVGPVYNPAPPPSANYMPLPYNSTYNNSGGDTYSYQQQPSIVSSGEWFSIKVVRKFREKFA